MNLTQLPNNVPADVREIAGRLQAGTLTGVREARDALLRGRPDDFWGHYLAGEISLAEGQIPDAVGQFRLAIRSAADNECTALGWNSLAQAMLALRKYEQAAEAFRLATRLNPACIAYSLDFAQALEASGKLHLAEEVLRNCMRRDPENPAPLTALAGVWTQHGRQQDALNLLDKALRLDPFYPPAFFNASTALAMLGKTKAAYVECREALRLAPALPHYYQLVNLGALDDAQISMLERRVAENSDATVTMRMDAGFALAAVYANRGHYDMAFEMLTLANRLKHATVRFNISESASRVRMLKAFFTPALFARFGNRIQSKLRPIFIVGMPRSGSTLIEQLLGAHPEVMAGGELLYLPRVCGGIGQGSTSPSAVGDAGIIADLTRACAEYTRLTEPLWRNHSRFTDKLLSNYRMLGMIQLLFPKAAIIHIRRDPFDTCLSCYERLFSSQMDFVYDLRELGAEYQLYEQLMQHWHGVLPAGRILDVDYEAVVTEPESQVRRMLEHCGLPFDAVCLDFASAAHTVTTASLVQVRRLLYRGSVGRWRNYRAHLQPLADALGRKLPD